MGDNLGRCRDADRRAADDRASAGRSVVPAPDLASRLAALIRVWLAWSRQRRLYEIAQRNDCLLKDIGISRQDAFREAKKPFWPP